MVDVSAGLALLSQAVDIVKNLREIDKGFDAAALKARMADLYGTLADVKIALSDARETIYEREQTIRNLEERIATLASGEACPICSSGRMKVISSHKHPTFGDLGVLERTLKCDRCDHTENHLHDPSGLTRGR